MVNECGVGVRSWTWCARPSVETRVTWTARNAGAEMLAVSSLPPARIANVAGTLTLVEPL